MLAGVAALQVLYRAVNYQMEPEEPKSEDEAAEAEQSKVGPSPPSLVLLLFPQLCFSPYPLHGRALPRPAPPLPPPNTFYWP